MQSNDLRALCVSVHDVAPSTWDACQRLIEGVRQVADIPLTLLVVPNYHRLGELACDAYETQLNQCLEHGHELALHGYTHLDEEPMGLFSRFDRTVRTAKEGEFAAMSQARATLRLERGTAWFAQRRWPLTGFVAPAWLLSSGTWQALRDFAFGYTTTLNRFYMLPDRNSILSPSLVYSSRNRWLYRASRGRNHLLASLLSEKSLLRLSLHPPDAIYETMSDWQTLLHSMLKTRTAMTKAQFARLNANYA